jgi:hypothetical protein
MTGKCLGHSHVTNSIFLHAIVPNVPPGIIGRSARSRPSYETGPQPIMQMDVRISIRDISAARQAILHHGSRQSEACSGSHPARLSEDARSWKGHDEAARDFEALDLGSRAVREVCTPVGRDDLVTNEIDCHWRGGRLCGPGDRGASPQKQGGRCEIVRVVLHDLLSRQFSAVTRAERRRKFARTGPQIAPRWQGAATRFARGATSACPRPAHAAAGPSSPR